jgi:poly(A) polymerase
MRLRADVGEVEESLASWWQEFQQADDARREDLVAQAREEQRQRPEEPSTGTSPPCATRRPQQPKGDRGRLGCTRC